MYYKNDSYLDDDVIKGSTSFLLMKVKGESSKMKQFSNNTNIPEWGPIVCECVLVRERVSVLKSECVNVRGIECVYV